jgi:hypothetical protein
MGAVSGSSGAGVWLGGGVYGSCGAGQVDPARRGDASDAGVVGRRDVAGAPFLTRDDGQVRPVHQWSPPQRPDVTLYTPAPVCEDD